MHASASVHWIVGFPWQGDIARGHPCHWFYVVVQYAFHKQNFHVHGIFWWCHRQCCYGDQLLWLYSDMNIHSANILQLFQQYVVSQDAPLSHQYVDQVWSPSCSYQGNKWGYAEVGAQSAIQYKLVGTALMGQKTHDFLQWFTPKHTPH